MVIKKKKKQYNVLRDENFRTVMPEDGKTLPPGRYYIGDLCYVMHPEWPEVIQLIFPDDDEHSPMREGVHRLPDGRRFAIYSTKYGDGKYYSSMGGSFSVDSGTIGAILIDDITDEEATTEWIEQVGGIFNFQHRVETANHDGTLEFGRVVIFTSDEFEYDPNDPDRFQSGY